MTKLKKSNFDKTQKHKFLPNSKTQCDQTPKKIVTKLENSNLDKTKKFKLRQQQKTQIWTLVIVTAVTVAVVTVVIVTSSSKNNLTPQQPMRCSWGRVSQFSFVFF